MLPRVRFVLLAALLAVGAFAPPAGARECLEVMQHKYCVP